MSEKSSIDYTELAGLRIFISHYKTLYKEKDSKHQTIISEIETRIRHLENK